MKFRERMQRFMYGRYGTDGLGKFLSWTSVILLLCSMLFGFDVLYFVSVGLLVWCYFRMFSRNVQKRYQENCVYYRYVNIVSDFFKRQKSYMKQSKTHHIYKCPQCKQKIRIPKGKGKVAIRCQRCGTEFIKNSR